MWFGIKNHLSSPYPKTIESVIALHLFTEQVLMTLVAFNCHAWLVSISIFCTFVFVHLYVCNVHLCICICAFIFVHLCIWCADDACYIQLSCTAGANRNQICVFKAFFIAHWKVTWGNSLLKQKGAGLRVEEKKVSVSFLRNPEKSAKCHFIISNCFIISRMLTKTHWL